MSESGVQRLGQPGGRLGRIESKSDVDAPPVATRIGMLTEEVEKGLMAGVVTRIRDKRTPDHVLRGRSHVR
jgi:hypothetical protein